MPATRPMWKTVRRIFTLDLVRVLTSSVTVFFAFFPRHGRVLHRRRAEVEVQGLTLFVKVSFEDTVVALGDSRVRGAGRGQLSRPAGRGVVRGRLGHGRAGGHGHRQQGDDEGGQGRRDPDRPHVYRDVVYSLHDLFLVSPMCLVCLVCVSCSLSGLSEILVIRGVMCLLQGLWSPSAPPPICRHGALARYCRAAWMFLGNRVWPAANRAAPLADHARGCAML